VVIVGAGIGGPALGIALKRAGIESIVYEASDEPRDDAGAFLNLAPNGLAVLQALGLGWRLDGLGFQNDRLVFHNETGRTLAEVAVGGVTVMRGAVSRVLREAAEEAGVRFEFGKTLSSLTEHSGCHCAVRRWDDCRWLESGRRRWHPLAHPIQLLHRRTETDVHPGIINLGGVVHTGMPPTGRAMHMIFGRSGFFGYAVRPGGETYWFSNFAQKEEPSRDALVSATSDSYRQRLLDVHGGDPPEVTRILQALSGPIGAWPVYDILSLPAWHRGAVCLIGDAAHAVGPHVGQGASLALEDAFVLAKCLRDIPQASSAFSAFERLRRSRVEPILKQSRRTGQQKAPTGWLGRRIRDLILPIFLKSGAPPRTAPFFLGTEWST